LGGSPIRPIFPRIPAGAFFLRVGTILRKHWLEVSCSTFSQMGVPFLLSHRFSFFFLSSPQAFMIVFPTFLWASPPGRPFSSADKGDRWSLMGFEFLCTLLDMRSYFSLPSSFRSHPCLPVRKASSPPFSTLNRGKASGHCMFFNCGIPPPLTQFLLFVQEILPSPISCIGTGWRTLLPSCKVKTTPFPCFLNNVFHSCITQHST